MEGYVEKKKISNALRSYKSRYCRINGPEATFEYYTSPNDKKSKGVINLVELESVDAKPSSKTKMIIESTTHKWAYSILCHSEAERDAWLEHLKVWVNVKAADDHIAIPPVLARGILACIEFCMFYAGDVEGLLRVPGNSTVVKEIYYGICRFGDQFLLKPKDKLAGYRPDPTLFEESGDPNAKNVNQISQGVRLGKDGLQVYDVFDVGSCVKLALKLLPETLLTNWIFDHFMAAQTVDDYKAVISELPGWNAIILRAIMELTLQMWQGEEVTKMDPGKVAVCLGPNLLKRKSDVGFCDFSFMFFEMAQHIDEIFGDIKVPKYFPENFYDYLSDLDENYEAPAPEKKVETSPSKDKHLISTQSSEKTGRALPPPNPKRTTNAVATPPVQEEPVVSPSKYVLSDEEEKLSPADQPTKGDLDDDDDD